MHIKFSKNPFFLWSTFTREAEVISETKDSLIVATKIKKLELNPDKYKFFAIKYLVAFILIVVAIPPSELLSIDPSAFLGPLFALVVSLYGEHSKKILLFSILPILALFFYLDIHILPYFVKYFIASYVLIELFQDVFNRNHYAVSVLENYENTDNKNEKDEKSEDITVSKNELVSFASINKNIKKGVL